MTNKDAVQITQKYQIALVGSGGGHLRQLKDIAPGLKDFDVFFVTETSGLSDSLKDQYHVENLPHFAFGQKKTGSYAEFLTSGFANAFKSFALAFKTKPDLVISTGAGSAFFYVLMRRLLGSRYIFIESFARVDGPSLFGRLSHKFANRLIVQWPGLLKTWPHAVVCNPLHPIDLPSGQKPRTNVFVTVGTTHPFDRMIKAVETLKNDGRLTAPVTAQIGNSSYAPSAITCFKSCNFETMQQYLCAADIAVCHGGTGSLIVALQSGAAVVAMAREAKFNEHYDDHQVEIVRAFAERGLIEVAHDADSLASSIERIKVAQRRSVRMDSGEMIKVIRDYIDSHI